MASNTNSNSGAINWRWIFSFVSFVAITIIGFALLLGLIIGKSNSVSVSLMTIAEVLAYIVVAFYAFAFAWRKRGRNQVIYLSIWLAAVILIVVCLVLLKK